MARHKISTQQADPVRAYVEGVAKSLVDRLYGDKGPAWGTKLSAIEDTILAIRQVLSEKMLDEALQRQASTVLERPAAFRCCPKCGKEVEDKDGDGGDSRILLTNVGEAEWCEPATNCRSCRRSFFPSDQELGD
jgi:NADH pyrophosphatase NudC (nudix superfamily)